MSASAGYNPNDFQPGLKPFKSRLLKIASSEVVLGLAAITVAVLVLAMWLDTVVALTASTRWLVSRVSLCVAALGVVGLIWWRSRAITAEQIAQQLDQASGSGGELLAGWQLATGPVRPANELAQGFAALAAQRALRRLASLSPDLISDWRLTRRAAWTLLGLLCAVAIVSLLAPQATRNQFYRFLYPASDVPPYTGIVIELELEREQILYGQDVLVTAQVPQGRVGRMLLSSKNELGQEQLLPMLSQSDHKFQAVLTRVTEPLTLVARSGSSRSTSKRLNVTLTPKILPPTVVITPPAYTRGSVYQGAIPDQGLVGLKGTQVDWTVRSNRPLAEGKLTLQFSDGQTEVIKLTPAASAGSDSAEASADAQLPPVVGSFALSRPGQFELKVVDVEGIESQESIKGSITILSDKRPVVRIVQPQPLSLATPDVKLPVTVIAEDDYGITQLTLFRSLNGSPATPTQATVDGSPRMQGEWQLSLPDYGLEAGDEIQLFARAEDNDPAGAKGAESPITIVRIISVAEYQEMMVQRQGAESMQAKYQAARRYYDQLASALEDVQAAQKALAEAGDSPEAKQELKEKLEAAQKAAEQAAAEIDKLSEQALPIDVDQELAKELEQMSEQAAQMAEQLKQMKNSPGPASELAREDVNEMLKQTKQAQEDITENAIDPLSTMQQTMPLMIDQRRFEELAAQQRDLSERLKALRADSKDDPASTRRLAELESEQQQLKQSLADLLDDIEAHAQALPQDPELDKLRETALEFAQKVRESQAQAEMNAAQENLLSDKYPEAQGAAEKAAEILEGFLSSCESMGEGAEGQCKAAFKPGAQPKVGNSLKQMMRMMGMKPGSSGKKPGGQPGQGFGFGAGGGYAQRFPGPQNVGMYGAMPMTQASSGRSRGDRQSAGFQTSETYDTAAGGNADKDTAATSQATGQSLNAIPANYRSKVAEYFRQLNAADTGDQRK